MTALITLLISLLGYGTPEDYKDYSEDQLNEQIEYAESSSTTDDGGGTGGWDSDHVYSDTQP